MNFAAKESLVVDGTIDARGGNGVNIGSAGGSGGSVLLQSKVIKGKGLLIADGGNGDTRVNGGGGGGGRIAMHSDTNAFTGMYRTILKAISVRTHIWIYSE